MASVAEPLGVLVDPVDGMRRAVEGRRWFWPLLAIAFSTAGAGLVSASRWNAEPTVVRQLEHDSEMASTTEQELTGKVQTSQRIAQVGGVAKGLLWMPLAVLLVAVALKGVAWLIGRRALFGRCFSASAIAFLPICVYCLVFLLLAARTAELSPEQAAVLVPSHLDVFIHAGPKLGRVLSAVDFFNLWSAALLGLGFAAAAGISRRRGVLFGLCLYAAYAAVAIVALPGLQGPPT